MGDRLHLDELALQLQELPRQPENGMDHQLHPLPERPGGAENFLAVDEVMMVGQQNQGVLIRGADQTFQGAVRQRQWDVAVDAE